MFTLPRPVLAFYKSVLKDLALTSSYYRECNRPSEHYLLKRLCSEGIIFVSKSLPELGKAAEISMITGKPIVVPQTFKLRWMSRLPVFLGNYFQDAWDDDGRPKWVLAEPDDTGKRTQSYAFYCIRQVCLAYSKATDLGTLVSDEDALKAFSERISGQPEITAPSWLLNAARHLLRSLLMEGDKLNAMLAQWDEDPIGKHGPGAVACKEKDLLKWNFRRISGLPPKLFTWRSSTEDTLGWIEPSIGPFVKGETESVARAVCVPKDFRGPRIICIEPKENQFGQQGLWSVLSSLIHTHTLTRKSIRFDDQSRNANLCKRRDLATIDLKDASDTVSLKLCRLLLPKEVFSLVTRFRSRAVSINGNIKKSECLASMGSAVCFPMETLVFWAIAQSAIHPNDSRLPVRVFGDDIIVPKGSAMYVVKMLEACGFKVNSAKTCIETPVRESCGAYTMYGHDIRVTRFRASSVDSLPAWNSLLKNAKELNERMLCSSSLAMLETLAEYAKVPWGLDCLPSGIAELSRCRSRYNKELQRREFLLPTAVMRGSRGSISAGAGLYAWLVGNPTQPSSSGNLSVKMKWVDADTAV